ncbi:hypothetical protein [Cysteiniphilum marinum]|nr:hypothetical protein [Cysteiniphilum marinum]
MSFKKIGKIGKINNIKKKWLGVIVLLAFSSTSFAATCHFKQPAIDTDVCKNLNLNKKVEDNPFFMKNMNGICGKSFQLSGLPDFSLTDYLPDFGIGNACDLMKFFDGDAAIDEINKYLNF